MKNFKLRVTALSFVLIIAGQSCRKDSNDSINSTESALFQSDMPTLGVELLPKAEYEALPKAERSASDLETRAMLPALRLETPAVSNQGGEGSCTAFAIGYGAVSFYLHSLCRLPYTTTDALRSPEFLYNTTKFAGSCESAGSTLVRVFNSLVSTGVCSWAEMPYTSGDCSLQPNGSQQVAASLARLENYKTVLPQDVKYNLSIGNPVIMAFAVDNNFDVQTRTTPYTYTSKGGAIRGGHAVMIMGYDDVKRVYVVQNSWGTAYHDRGFFYISYDLFASVARELYIVKPQEAWVVQNGIMIGSTVKACTTCGSADVNQYQLSLQGTGLTGWEIIPEVCMKSVSTIERTDNKYRINVMFKFIAGAATPLRKIRLKKGFETREFYLSTPFTVVN